MDVKDVMHTAVTTVTPETRVSTAYQIMTMRGTRIRHLPVVTDEGCVVGMLTDRDIRRAAASDVPSMATHELSYLLGELRVREVMTPNVVSVQGTTPVEDAGQLFLQHKVGCLPVLQSQQRLDGILTVTDILRAYIAQSETATPIGVREMMQTQLITATPTTSLGEVQRLMQQHNIRHVLVVSGRHLVGLITDRDLREAVPSPATTLTRGESAYRMESTPIKTCMTQDVVFVGPDITMIDAARVLVQRMIGCLPIVDNGTLVGVVTEIDCVRAFLHNRAEIARQDTAAEG